MVGIRGGSSTVKSTVNIYRQGEQMKARAEEGLLGWNPRGTIRVCVVGSKGDLLTSRAVRHSATSVRGKGKPSAELPVMSVNLP